jgi:chromosome segregation ATPase
MFTDNGDIRMDIFARHFRRADKVVENVREAKETLQKQYQEEQAAHKEANSLLESRRRVFQIREAAYEKRKAIVDSFTLTHEQAEHNREEAKTAQGDEAAEIEGLTVALSDVHAQIEDSVNESTTIPPENADYSKLRVINAAYERSASVRTGIILSIEDRSSTIGARVAEADAKVAIEQKRQSEAEAQLAELDSRALNAIGLLCGQSEDLNELEFCVEALAQEASEYESMYKAINQEAEVYPDHRTEIAALENAESKHARRRSLLEKKRELIRSKMRELRLRMRRRVQMSPRKGVNLGQEKPEVIAQNMNGRYNEIMASQESISALLSDLDAFEAKNSIERITIEGQWEAKMSRIEQLRKEVAEHGEAEVEIAQEFEETDNLAEVEKDLRSKLESLHRRLEMVEEEMRRHMDKDPELGFLRERTEGKQMRVDSKEANLAERTQFLREGVADANDKDITAEELIKRVFEAEAQVVAFGPRIADATEALRTEERLLDEALSNLPVHVKIQVLARL